MLNKKNILLVIFGVSLAANAFFIGKYLILSLDYKEAQRQLERERTNKKIADFAELFIEKVLKAEKDVDFDERIRLETAVRELNDEEILLQWKRFTDSKTGEEAQQEVKNLLGLLAEKISY